MGFAKTIKKGLSKSADVGNSGIKVKSLVSGFSIIKREQEEFKKRREMFEKGGGNIFEAFVTNDKPSFIARFAWDGDENNLQHALMHRVSIFNNKVGKMFTKRKICSMEIGLDTCGGCESIDKKVRNRSRVVVFPLLNREERTYKEKVYKDSLMYILAGATTQLDIFMKKAKELEDMDLKFNEVDFLVEKLNAGTKNATWYLTPQLKTKRKLTKEEIDKFNLFDINNTQFAPLTQQEWRSLEYVTEENHQEESNDNSSTEYSW